MRNNLCKLLFLTLSIFFASVLFTMAGEMEHNVQKNIYDLQMCLLPDYQQDTVKPVIGSRICDNSDSNVSMMLEEKHKVGNVYAVRDSQKSMNETQQSADTGYPEPNRKLNINPEGWIITVD